MINKARILYLVKADVIGGAERIILDLVSHFEKKSEVTICITFSELLSKLTKSVACQHFLLRSKNYFSISNYRAIRKIIVENEINIVHTVHRTFLPLIWLLKIRLSFVSLYSAVNVFNDYKNIFFKTDYFTALSSSVYKNLVNYHRIDEKKISLIMHGVAREKIFNEINRQIEVNRKITLGYAGRFEKEKGLKILLETYAQIDKTKFSLVLKGEGSIKNDLVHYSSRLDLKKDVVFQCWEEDLNAFWRSIDVLILPSLKSEGLGIILLEALAHGKLIIATDVGGIQDVIIDDWNGFLVSANNVLELKTAINKLIEFDEWHRLKENGYKTLEKFDLKTVLIQYEELYNRILSSHVKN